MEFQYIFVILPLTFLLLGIVLTLFLFPRENRYYIVTIVTAVSSFGSVQFLFSGAGGAYPYIIVYTVIGFIGSFLCSWLLSRAKQARP